MELEALRSKALADIAFCVELSALEQLRVDLLGKKGLVTEQLKALGTLPPEQRKSHGALINQLRDQLESTLGERKQSLLELALNEQLAREAVDIHMPGRMTRHGSIHPISRTLDRIERILANSGFVPAQGPEIEDDEHNFEALNFPPHHPARAMHDTFYFGDGRLLRTHTSPVQIRAMREGKAPIRVLAAGKVYRSDSDQTHSPMFHQVEGLLIDQGVSFAQLKGMLYDFVQAFFEREFEMRFRPSYFPFTEPSAEVDIRWQKADGSNAWLEVLGCGMVHPNVLRAGGIDPERYTGFAFGLGVERFAMLRYGVSDLRAFFENDIRFLSQFGA
jgi:phenylalanyl-tRNA synthetase alpha chain